MFFKRIKPRSFDYQPRYYKHDNDQEKRRKRKLGFRSSTTIKRKRGSIIYLAIIFIIILYLFIKFSGV